MHFQDALIESEKRIRLIIENSLSAIVIMNSYGIVTEWNHPAEKIFGWTKEEAIGRRLDELIIPPAQRDAHRQGLERFLRTGVGPFLNKLIEQTAIRRDGTEFPVELSISSLRLGNSLYIQWLYSRHHRTQALGASVSASSGICAQCDRDGKQVRNN